MKLKQKVSDLKKQGIVPYIATSENYIDCLNTDLLGDDVVVRFLENEDHTEFHKAYIFTNFLGFRGSDVEMPNWVYIDFILLQTAVIGFAISKEHAPKTLLENISIRPDIDLNQIDYIPISGMTTGTAINKSTLMGFSLFSLRTLLPELDLPGLGTLTKAIGLSAQKASEYEEFTGISQYDNPALKIHGLFGPKMYIKTPMVPLHPMADMTMIYSMHIDLDEKRLFEKTEEAAYDFLLRADDKDKKQEMASAIAQGHKFYIAPPFQIQHNGVIHLPIKEEK